jgi:hypothetical protein
VTAWCPLAWALGALLVAASPASAQTDDVAEEPAIDTQFDVAIGLHWASALLGTGGGVATIWGITSIATFGVDDGEVPPNLALFVGGIAATSTAFILLCVAIGLQIDGVSRRDALRRRLSPAAGPGDLGVGLALRFD